MNAPATINSGGDEPAVRAIKIVVPDSGPINTLAAAGLLDLLLAPKNATLVLVDAVVREIVSKSEELAEFIEKNRGRIEVVSTEVESNIQKIFAAGMTPETKNAGESAISEFMLDQIDKVSERCPALVIFEDKRMPRLRANAFFSENVHLITTAAYLRKLEESGIIESFDATWERVVSSNHDQNPKLSRSPNHEEREIEADHGSRIEFGM